MSSIIIDKQNYPLAPGATVLDTLLEAGLNVAFGCRAGSCQSCLLRATAGKIPAEAQHGLKDTLKTQGWFLPCRCKPTETLTIDLNAGMPQLHQAKVVGKCLLSRRVMGLWLKCREPFDYRAGQYINLRRDQTTARSYSLAGLPHADDYLELHIARIDGGAVSPWVHDELQVGESIEIEGPMGDCFYVSGTPEQPLLLVGTGTGLAPLYGIVRDALHNGHNGPIHLFHGARTNDYLYYYDELKRLSGRHENLHYHPSLVEAAEPAPVDVEVGAVNELVARQLPELSGWRVYLSGAPDLVNQLRKQCFLAGAASNAIHTDPFI
ncbi:MAG: FAD-binding oxidoreductase [Pseudomonadota bacterium]